jgi:hypothetical protein
VNLGGGGGGASSCTSSICNGATATAANQQQQLMSLLMSSPLFYQYINSKNILKFPLKTLLQFENFYGHFYAQFPKQK